LKLFTLIITLSLFLVACGGNSNTKATPKGPALAAVTTVTINTEIPFSKDNRVAENIKSECQLPKQLADFIDSYSTEKGIKITRNANLTKDSSGPVLMVNIIDSVSSGNAFTGHRKLSRVKGELYKDGQLYASFEGQRHSGGGAFGGWKGSCSVLGRTVKALGKDISGFLMAPRMDARIGEG